MTLWPKQADLDRGRSGVLGFDDGARTFIWTAQAPRLAQAPVLGTGFYHRGDDTGLFNTGSHNFWLQMFLETGVPGGLLMLAFVGVLWRDAGSDRAAVERLKHPIRAALVAAVVGGLGGEYFYGGTVLFSLLLVYAPVGSLPVSVPVRIRTRGATAGVARRMQTRLYAAR